MTVPVGPVRRAFPVFRPLHPDRTLSPRFDAPWQPSRLGLLLAAAGGDGDYSGAERSAAPLPAPSPCRRTTARCPPVAGEVAVCCLTAPGWPAEGYFARLLPRHRRQAAAAYRIINGIPLECLHPPARATSAVLGRQRLKWRAVGICRSTLSPLGRLTWALAAALLAVALWSFAFNEGAPQNATWLSWCVTQLATEPHPGNATLALLGRHLGDA